LTIYSVTEAKEQLDVLLEEARREGEILIKREDGQIFVIRPEAPTRWLLDVQGVDLGLSMSDIVKFVREGRARP
jgi:hypothetical protein